jgi:DNA-binding transcriptional MerR regulator
MGQDFSMKTGKLGKMMGFDPDTLINWTKRPELSRFFSEGAMRINAQRDFNDSDVAIINTIRAYKDEGLSWGDIAAKIEAGERVHEFPPSAAGVDGITPIEVYAKGLVSKAELDTARQQIAELKEQINELLRDREEAINTVRKEKDTEIRELNREHKQSEVEMGKEIGKLQAQVEFLQEQLQKRQGE